MDATQVFDLGNRRNKQRNGGGKVELRDMCERMGIENNWNNKCEYVPW